MSSACSSAGNRSAVVDPAAPIAAKGTASESDTPAPARAAETTGHAPTTGTRGAEEATEIEKSLQTAGPAETTVKPKPATSTKPQETLAVLPSGTKVLHIGDSFAGALGYELNKALQAHGVTGVLKYEKSTYIPTWASNRELPRYLQRYQPDLVVITLGANELEIPDPTARAETVARLVQRLGERPCVWIGIPLWEGAKAELLEVIRANVAPCLYLDSNQIVPNLPRARDKIHPSTSARQRWAEEVVAWLRRQQSPTSKTQWQWRK